MAEGSRTGKSIDLRQRSRVLAIDLRRSRLGFAVLEGYRIIDAGVRRNRTSRPIPLTWFHTEVEKLIRSCMPAAIVVRCTDCVRVRQVFVFPGVRVSILRVVRVKRYFSDRGAANKFAIANLIASRLSVPSSINVPRRKTWQPEHDRQVVLDAIAAGVCFLNIFSTYLCRVETSRSSVGP